MQKNPRRSIRVFQTSLKSNVWKKFVKNDVWYKEKTTSFQLGDERPLKTSTLKKNRRNEKDFKRQRNVVIMTKPCRKRGGMNKRSWLALY